jgi:hypothetical protein
MCPPSQAGRSSVCTTAPSPRRPAGSPSSATRTPLRWPRGGRLSSRSRGAPSWAGPRVAGTGLTIGQFGLNRPERSGANGSSPVAWERFGRGNRPKPSCRQPDICLAVAARSRESRPLEGQCRCQGQRAVPFPLFAQKRKPVTAEGGKSVFHHEHVRSRQRLPIAAKSKQGAARGHRSDTTAAAPERSALLRSTIRLLLAVRLPAFLCGCERLAPPG